MSCRQTSASAPYSQVAVGDTLKSGNQLLVRLSSYGAGAWQWEEKPDNYGSKSTFAAGYALPLLGSLQLLSENSTQSMSKLCESLLEDQTDHARGGNDLWELQAELQWVSGKLEDLKKTGTRLAEKPRQQQTHYQQDWQAVQAQRDEIERLKRQEKKNMQQALLQQEAAHVLIPTPAGLEEVIAKLCKEYKRTKLNTLALVLAKCMFEQVLSFIHSPEFQAPRPQTRPAGTVTQASQVTVTPFIDPDTFLYLLADRSQECEMGTHLRTPE